jgi:putative membrane protein
MRTFLIRWLIHALSLGAAASMVPGLEFPGNPPTAVQVIVVAGLFGVLNAAVKPLLQLAACGLYVFTLGLIHFVINAAILQLTGWLAAGWLHVADFWAAFQGALVISVVGTVLTWMLDPEAGQVEGKRAEARVVRRPGDGDIIDGE